MTIDIGNTRVKSAVFDDKNLLEVKAFDKATFEEEVRGVFNRNPNIRQAIISSVAESAANYESVLTDRVRVFHLDQNLSLNFSSKYDDLSKLGADRKALIAAAVTIYPAQNVLVIDMGSCVTYDMVDCSGLHRGGGISPGWQMRLNAMHTFTGRLPQLSTLDDSIEKKEVTGMNTQQAMFNSTFFGLLAEIDQRIEHYKSEFPDLTVILTGGDAQSFSVRLKNRIFAHSNFLLEGLNALLEHNL
ncbi:MAG: Type III pantothenate kinase [Flavobacteriaceae bacterium]|nr:type III pantothenate kinase [Flavobacteriaceae bacterium]CAI8180825.1 MAG: Type III pantothenate kinase [Flavobacteriaceae bacterium]